MPHKFRNPSVFGYTQAMRKEPLVDALVREVEEELGIKVSAACTSPHHRRIHSVKDPAIARF